MIPALRGRVAVDHERPRWFARVEAELAGGQERVGEFETPTAGYEMSNVVTGLRFNVAGRLSVLTASLENVTNEEYRILPPSQFRVPHELGGTFTARTV